MFKNNNKILKPIKINFKKSRIIRQERNNKIVFANIKKYDRKNLYKNINKLELNRILEDLDLTLENFLVRCNKDNYFCKLACRNISKKSSRQGYIDEIEQIKVCNLIGEICGIKIKILGKKDYRATKDGRILSNNDIIKEKINKDNCLKSFDGILEGKINGYIVAKVSYGKGGHQDNVFEEINIIGEWWKKYKKDMYEILVILLDTDLINRYLRIKNKYSNIKNIIVCNHIEFQKYMIENYSNDNVERI